jgi:hypothetical protein
MTLQARLFPGSPQPLADKSHNVLRIICAVGVVGDAAAFVGADLILVDDPVERGPIAQPILKYFGRNSTQI